MSTDWDDLNCSNETNYLFSANNALSSADAQQQKTPFRTHSRQILHCVENHQVTIVACETGSGKSVPIAQLLHEYGWHVKGMIGVIVTRRVTAMSFASELAQQMNEMVGQSVGYDVNLMESTSAATKIKFITESIMLQELMRDPLLTDYSVIVVEDAHERRLLTDTMLGFLKRIGKRRSMIKIIVLCSLLQAAVFQHFFEPMAVVVEVNEKTAHQQVDIFYAQQPCANYVEATLKTALRIHEKESFGDILAYLTGQDEIRDAQKLMNEYMTEGNIENLKMCVIKETLYSKEQMKTLWSTPKGVRKLILTSSMAESSFRIPGIVYVIDCGFEKLKYFNCQNYTESLIVVPISKATAIERAQRVASNTSRAKVYRLYGEQEYEKFAELRVCEMRRSEMSAVVMFMKSLGISNILRFEFPSAPPAKNFLAALERLYALGALDESGQLTTPVGNMMAEMPFDCMLAKMLIKSGEMGCSEEILSIVAMLQVQNIYSRPASFQAQQKQQAAKRYFEVSEGDLLTLLNVYTAFTNNGQTKEFCGKYNLIYRNLMNAIALREQLAKLLSKKFKIPLVSCASGESKQADVIGKCITAGFFINAAHLHYSGSYRNIRSGTELHIHPLSTLYNLAVKPAYIVYCEQLQSTQIYINFVSATKKEWLTEVAGNYYFESVRK